MRRFMVCALGACLWAAGALAASPPEPAESEWLVTKIGIFVIQKGASRWVDSTLRYQMEFSLRRPVTETLYVTVDFENPVDQGTPLFAEFEVAPGATSVDATSESFSAIRNRHEYLVKVWIYADVKRKQLLGTHEQLVLFQMPRELLDQLGVRLL
jgi:hypothetical protein